jgi:hypothetical protein
MRPNLGTMVLIERKKTVLHSKPGQPKGVLCIT